MVRRNVKVCQFWSCNRRIPLKHFLCEEHYDDWDEYLIDKCPICGQYKDLEYETCLNCRVGRTPRKKPSLKVIKPNQDKGIEYSPAWSKGDKKANLFFVYILKLSGGTFYVGQTRDLRERVSEHKDDRVQTTAGRNPKLACFEEKQSRYDATTRERELKKVNASNPRQIRKMILEFKDRIREVD